MTEQAKVEQQVAAFQKDCGNVLEEVGKMIVGHRDIVEGVIIAMLSAALGVVLSLVLAPLFPMRVDIPQGAFLLLPVVAVAIGLIASGAGLRRAVSVDPALAFGGP